MALAALACAFLASSAGDSRCPCLDSTDLSDFLVVNGTALSPGINDYVLPTDYGRSCKQHDVMGSYCSGSEAAWCAGAFCWVDPGNCSLDDVSESFWFPGHAHYSYVTCGSEDHFTDSGTFESMPYGVERTASLVPPLASVTSCMDLDSPSDSCGRLVYGRDKYNNDWCMLKQQVESGAKSFADVLNGQTLDVTIIPQPQDAYWINSKAGERLGGIVADILNWVATDANFTYNLFAIPAPARMGYLTASGSADWTRWTVDQASRTDLLAQWTTDTWQRRQLGVVWPYHHLALDHVLIVRSFSASSSDLSIEDWPSFVKSSTESVCVYGGIVRSAMLSVLPVGRVKEKADASEAEAHEWAVRQLCAGECAGYVQPKDKAEIVLAQFNAGGQSNLHILEPLSSQRTGLGSYDGGFATVLPFAREQVARQASGNPNATAGGGACTDLPAAAFSFILQKMFVKKYSEFRMREVAAIRASSAQSLTCPAEPPSPPPPQPPPSLPLPPLPPPLLAIVPDDQEDQTWVIAVIAVAIMIFLLVTSLLSTFLMRKALTRARERAQEEERTRLFDALDTTRSLQFPAVLVRLADFVAMGKLKTFEQLRDSGVRLRFFDDIEQLEVSDGSNIVFLSHQWTALKEPDPSGKQYRTMISSIAHVCNVHDWNPERVLVWCDYCSVPQGHKAMQGLAINSIASYAACAAAFIIVAPDIQHNDLPNVVCDAATYQKRLWTRVEQLCHGLANGSDHMWLAKSPAECRQVASEENWLSASLHVFEGEATDEYDKLTLVMPLLGLYAQLYATHSPSQDGNPRHILSSAARAQRSSGEEPALMHQAHVWHELCEHKATIFPSRIVIRQQIKPQTQAQATGGDTFRKVSSTANGRGESSKKRGLISATHAPSEKPLPERPLYMRRFTGGMAGVSRTFELFGGLVEAMERLLEEDTELHRSVVQAVERRLRSLQAAGAAHRAEASEEKAAKRRSLFSAAATRVMAQKKKPMDLAGVQLEVGRS